MCHIGIPTYGECKHQNQKDSKPVPCIYDYNMTTQRCSGNMAMINKPSYGVLPLLCTDCYKRAQARILERERGRGHEAYEAYRQAVRSEGQQMEEAAAEHRRMTNELMQIAWDNQTAEMKQHKAEIQALVEARQRHTGGGW